MSPSADSHFMPRSSQHGWLNDELVLMTLINSWSTMSRMWLMIAASVFALPIRSERP